MSACFNTLSVSLSLPDYEDVGLQKRTDGRKMLYRMDLQDQQ